MLGTDSIREQMVDAGRNAPDSDSKGDTAVPAKPKAYAYVMDSLLGVLSASKVADLLASRSGNPLLVSDLGLVRSRLEKGDLEYKHYRPLSQLVIMQASDADIWSAVITLIHTVYHTTPPPSVPPSFDDTPITHSSASQQGAEQTEKMVEGRILEEIRPSDQVWKSAQTRYDGKWKDFPDNPTEDAVFEWWFDLQKEFLGDTRRAYYESSHRTIAGEARRKPDLIVKARQGTEPGAKYDWRDVAVIGDLKSSNYDPKSALLQIGRYVRDVFAHQPTRRFVHAFVLYGAMMEMWAFDRSGPYSAATFDVYEEPERFIQVLWGYVMMSHEELGLDTFVEKKDGKLFVTLSTDRRGKKRKLELDPEPIAYQRSSARTDDFDCVVKFSWTSAKRRPEAELLERAEKDKVKGLARMRAGLEFWNRRDIKTAAGSASSSFSQSQPLRSQSFSRSFSELHGLSIGKEPRKRKSGGEGSSSKRSRPDSQKTAQSGASFTTEGPFDNIILRVLAISPAGRSISQFRSPAELLEALCDAIEAHQSLYVDGKILHRDISENNIMITDPKRADGFKGLPIDLDFAKVGSGPSGTRHRTGTMQFMAIEVLLDFSHTYRHDLESSTAKDRPLRSLFTRWYTNNYREIASAKRRHMQIDGFEDILEEFPQPEFNCVKPLCREVRGILFPYRGLFVGTPQDPETPYGPIIGALDRAIDDIRFRRG
ncbi:hypothetical protein BDY21DRAFT_385711 [Lineolata rhizophorae]|uniref:non-specific serine/threonine protein kinase n=1 Tax=Lineolata rhizophorae TaxID=578093 RepID=A0A6A6P049_9PEZI|nr:hypothetical protein BDY21DRAFT_385711 [Lineolata rhizophorae]